MDWEGVVHHSGDNPIKHFCKVFSLPFAPDTKPFSVVENVFPFNKSLKVSLKKAIYMTAEGVPFMQAGEEFLRSKVKADGGLDENSYASPDSVNSLKWSNLEDDFIKNWPMR